MSEILFWAAAGLCGLTAGIHVFLGGGKFVRAFLALEIDPFQKWLSYLMWHFGTVSTLFMGAGFAAAALMLGHTDYAMIATAGAASFLATAFYVALRAGMPPLRFPVVPMFSLITLCGVAGVLV